MTGRYHNSRLTVQFSDRKREHRSRHKLAVYVNVNTVCSKYSCGSFCKNVRFNTAVISNSNTRLIKGFIDIISKSLSSSSYSINIHSVSACTNYASQAACSELKITVKSIINTLGIIGN